MSLDQCYAGVAQGVHSTPALHIAPLAPQLMSNCLPVWQVNSSIGVNLEKTYKKHQPVGLAQKEASEGLKGVSLCSSIFMCLVLQIVTELRGGKHTSKFHLFENR